MFENHMLQMYDTREIEMRAQLSERRVDLVPPLRGPGTGALGKLARWFRSALRRPQAHVGGTTAPSVRWL